MCDHTRVSERLGLDGDAAFCGHLVKEIGVAALPPSSFYIDRSLGKRFVRFGFCKKHSTIEAAVERLAAL